MKQGYVYIMSNKNRTTLYIGVTNSISKRVLDHKCGYGSQFTKRYNLHDLIYFEPILGMRNAINREKQLKKWHKEWKWNLIKAENPMMVDLALDWYTNKEIEDYKKELKNNLTDSETSSE